MEKNSRSAAGRGQRIGKGFEAFISVLHPKRLLLCVCAVLIAVSPVPIADFNAPTAMNVFADTTDDDDSDSAPVKALSGVTPQQSGGATIDLADSATASGDGWTYDSGAGIFTIHDGANVTIKGSTSKNTVEIASGATATVTLYNANITSSNTNSPVKVNSTATLNLKLKGANSLTGARTALYVPNGAALNITSADGAGSIKGVLDATTSDSHDATIGNRRDESNSGNGMAGPITINGGTINAIATGGCGAAIGGGDQSGATVVINGGAIYASVNNQSGYAQNGAAIGGGAATNKTVSVTIRGGSVYASARDAAIGENGS
ncbi:MAG: hypothetical protein LBL63_03090, partial [Clostridiales Family XIII bacterium]|nr:hypothetical protein [Clostridiales Family XIII bacterium]